METLEDLISWVGLKGSMTEEDSEVKTLLTVLGAEPDTQIRVIGSMTKEDYTAIINADAWQPSGRPPTPTVRSKAAVWGVQQESLMEWCCLLRCNHCLIKQRGNSLLVKSDATALHKTIQMCCRCPLLMRR